MSLNQVADNVRFHVMESGAIRFILKVLWCPAHYCLVFSVRKYQSIDQEMLYNSNPNNNYE